MAEEQKVTEQTAETGKSEQNAEQGKELRDDQLREITGGAKPRTFNPQPDPPA